MHLFKLTHFGRVYEGQVLVSNETKEVEFINLDKVESLTAMFMYECHNDAKTLVHVAILHMTSGYSYYIEADAWEVLMEELNEEYRNYVASIDEAEPEAPIYE